MTEHLYREWRIRVAHTTAWHAELLSPAKRFQATLAASDEEQALALALKFIDTKIPTHRDQTMMICSGRASSYKRG